jgi:hypothetical protein
MSARARNVEYSWRHQHAGKPTNQRVDVAAGHVGSALAYVRRATNEARLASDAFVEAHQRVRAHQERLGGGVHQIEGQYLVDWNEQRQAYFLVEYRVDTLYVWARKLLDDVAALLNVALPKSDKRPR